MANDKALVGVGMPKTSGAFFLAPAGTTLPTDSATALDAAFIGMGYLNEDGIANAIETESTDIKAWGGDTVRVIRTSRSETVTATFIESNEAVLKAAFGSENVTKDDTSGEITVKHAGNQSESYIMVAEIVLSDSRIKRIVIPDGRVDSVGEIIHKADEAIGYTLTIKCLPDADGVSIYEYLADVA